MSVGFPHRFSMLARDFRACAGAKPSDPGVATLLTLHELKLQERAGELVIEAYRDGVLTLDGLEDLVAFHTSKAASTKTKSRKGIAEFVRCPENLFGEIVGANQIEILNTNPPASSPLRSGGLLPRFGLLPESTPLGLERDAMACEVLGRLAEEALSVASTAFADVILMPSDLEILQAMAEKKESLMLLPAIMAAAGYRKLATRESLERLRRLGLVAKPKGTERKGDAITGRGREYLEYLHHNGQKVAETAQAR